MASEKNRIKAVIFDMDGVLIDAKEWHYEALNKALGLFGYGISRHDHLTTYDGLSTKKKLEMLSMEIGFPPELHEFVNEMKQIYTMETVYSLCKPVFNHEYALSRLKAEGFRLVVASNSVKQTVDLMMQKSNLDQYIEFKLSNEDVGNSKPDPEIYNCALGRLGLLPDECLVVEDNINGIKAAEAAGVHIMTVRDVDDVNYHNIISEIERAGGENTR
jgi:beta-phosphoglucomutase-like phosphatase (HAD superfamily)